ncbi:MAG: polymer-forming cytoskeletal protein [Acidobacteriota bacterium]
MAWKNPKDVDPSNPAPPSGSARTSSRLATLGPSISINGKLTGDEDLLIEGHVEGEISLKQNSVTIGRSGVVKADVYAKTVCIEGEIHGNLFGDDQVVIRQSGKVFGNLTAPRVTLEDGAKFRGAIDMEPKAKKAAAPQPKKAPQEQRASA